MPILNKNDPAALERYNAFARSSPYANATQDTAWAQVKNDWQSEYVYLEEKGEIVAGLSILFKPVLAGRSLAYAPRGPLCNVYDTALVQRLAAEALPLLRRHKAFVLRLDPEVRYETGLEQAYRRIGWQVRNKGFDKTQLIQPRYNMMLDLTDKSWETLMPEFSEKTRYNIRLAARKGVTVRHSRSVEDLATFDAIYRVTTQRDGIGARPASYFQRMLAAYPEDMLRIYIAEHEGEALSAAIAICYGGKMWYIYGASSNEKRNLMPNYAMQSAMIAWALERGCKIYDFGGVFVLDKSNGLFRFKEGFCHTQGTTELIGELDWVQSPLWYHLFTQTVPALQKIKANLTRRK